MIWEYPKVTKLKFQKLGSFMNKCISRVQKGWWCKCVSQLDIFDILEYVHVKIWISEFGVHMPIVIAVKVHWPHGGYLSYSTLTAFLVWSEYYLIEELRNWQWPCARKLASTLKLIWASTSIFMHYSPSALTGSLALVWSLQNGNLHDKRGTESSHDVGNLNP